MNRFQKGVPSSHCPSRPQAKAQQALGRAQAEFQPLAAPEPAPQADQQLPTRQPRQCPLSPKCLRSLVSSATSPKNSSELGHLRVAPLCLQLHLLSLMQTAHSLWESCLCPKVTGGPLKATPRAENQTPSCSDSLCSSETEYEPPCKRVETALPCCPCGRRCHSLTDQERQQSHSRIYCAVPVAQGQLLEVSLMPLISHASHPLCHHILSVLPAANLQKRLTPPRRPPRSQPPPSSHWDYCNSLPAAATAPALSAEGPGHWSPFCTHPKTRPFRSVPRDLSSHSGSGQRPSEAPLAPPCPCSLI